MVSRWTPSSKSFENSLLFQVRDNLVFEVFIFPFSLFSTMFSRFLIFSLLALFQNACCVCLFAVYCFPLCMCWCYVCVCMQSIHSFIILIALWRSLYNLNVPKIVCDNCVSFSCISYNIFSLCAIVLENLDFRHFPWSCLFSTTILDSPLLLFGMFPLTDFACCALALASARVSGNFTS